MTKVHMQGIDADQAVLAGLKALGLLTGEQSIGCGVFIFAHGAGASMDSEFMQGVADALAVRGVAVLRFEFSYMNRRRVDGVKSPPSKMPVLLDEFRELLRTVRALGVRRVVLGGKSMGGRAASMLMDEQAVSGCVCLGYPFHPVGRSSELRIDHLLSICTPTLIVQGERDRFGMRAEVEAYSLAEWVQYHWVLDGDHDFKPLKRSGVDETFEMEKAIDKVAGFIECCLRSCD